MATYTLPNIITKEDLLPFDLFPVADNTLAKTIVPIRNLETSPAMINLMLRNIGWSGFAYKDVDNIVKIGYNLTDGVSSVGLTEADAFEKWIKHFKDAERRFKEIFVLDSISQSQYDGMVSMYYFTGDWTRVGSEQRTFQLYDYVKNREWEYVATAMTSSGVNRIQRQLEAKVIMLADYGIVKDRSLIKRQGIQDIANKYPARMLDDKSRSQAEYVYYAETKRFLPNIAESRQRILSSKLNR
jgi:GH24 family phage-related lysozyme (muramidase)